MPTLLAAQRVLERGFVECSRAGHMAGALHTVFVTYHVVDI